ncbi:MAG: rRNA maturation RNase YbeY [Actinomycetota bacterium]
MTEHTRVTLSLENCQDVPVDEDRLSDMATRAACAEGACGEISIVLVDSSRMAQLNIEHLGGSGPTDVLAFPIDGLVTKEGDAQGPPVIIGEVILCPAVALDQAPQGPAGLAAELDLLVTHGVLHLLGYDHDTEEAAATMRGRELAVCGRSGARAS